MAGAAWKAEAEACPILSPGVPFGDRPDSTFPNPFEVRRIIFREFYRQHSTLCTGRRCQMGLCPALEKRAVWTAKTLIQKEYLSLPGPPLEGDLAVAQQVLRSGCLESTRPRPSSPGHAKKLWDALDAVWSLDTLQAIIFERLGDALRRARKFRARVDVPGARQVRQSLDQTLQEHTGPFSLEFVVERLVPAMVGENNIFSDMLAGPDHYPYSDQKGHAFDNILSLVWPLASQRVTVAQVLQACLVKDPSVDPDQETIAAASALVQIIVAEVVSHFELLVTCIIWACGYSPWCSITYLSDIVLQRLHFYPSPTLG